MNSRRSTQRLCNYFEAHSWPGLFVALGGLNLGCSSDSIEQSQQQSSTPESTYECGDATAVHANDIWASAVDRICATQHLVLPLHANRNGHADAAAQLGVDLIPFHFPDAGLHMVCFDDDDGELHQFQLIDETSHKTVIDLTASGECATVKLSKGNYSARFTHGRAGGTDDYGDIVFTKHKVFQTSLGELRRLDIRSNRCAQCDLSNITFAENDEDNVTNAVQSVSSIITYSQTFDGVDLSGSSLFGSNLIGAQFNNCVLSSVDFSYALLDKASFSAGTNLDSAIMTGASLTQMSVAAKGTIATNLDLSNAKMSGTVLAGLDLTGSVATHPPVVSADSTGVGVDLASSTVPWSLFKFADFAKLNLQGVSFHEAPVALAGTVFDGLKFPYVNFNWTANTDLRGTSWKSCNLTAVSFDNVDMGEQTEKSNRATDFTSATLTHASFGHTVLKNAILQKVSARNLYLDHTDLSGADLTGGADFSGSTGVYVKLDNAHLNDVIFDAAGVTALTESSFQNADLSNAHFTNVDLSYADFNGNTKFDKVHFVQATLTGADFSYANLTGLDASGAVLTSAILTNANLSGAVFGKSDSGKSASLAKAYLCGIKLTQAKADFSYAVLSDAFFPQSAQAISGAKSSSLTCSAVDLSQITTNAETVCPNGLKPAAGATGCSGNAWTPPAPPPAPCCTDPDDWCNNTLEALEACTDACDCDTRVCLATGACG